MKGILFISHGKMAEGIVDSLTMFFGERPKNIDHLGLSYDEGPESFKNQLEDKIIHLNKGDGVIVFADLFGGTPANTASLLANNDCQIISGMNLAMALECVGTRENSNLSINELVQTGKEGIMYINDILAEKNKND